MNLHPNIIIETSNRIPVEAEAAETHSSWLNQIERFFAKITNERIRRGVFRSVGELQHAIETYIAHHNQDPKLFRWTASADLILGKVAILCKKLA